MFGNGTRLLMASPFRFHHYGECGLPASELVTHTARHMDELCLIKSVQHDTVIHVPGEYMMTTGSIAGDRPSMGAWVNYGLAQKTRISPDSWSSGVVRVQPMLLPFCRPSFREPLSMQVTVSPIFGYPEQ